MVRIILIQVLVNIQGMAQVADTLFNNFSQPAYENLYEYLIENSGQEVENETAGDLTIKKIDINAATFDDWAQIGILTPSQISAILEHRKKHGNFLSTYELAAVNGMTESTLKQILPFLYVSEVNNFENSGTNKHELLTYWKNSFENDSSHNKYVGNTIRNRNSYCFESSQVSLQMLTEKDAGESWFSKQNPAFDYLSAAIEYRPQSVISKVIVGDYICQFGQGLVLGYQWDFSQNIYTANLFRIKSGVKRHRLYEENNFFRGISVETDKNGWKLTGWGSIKYRDATISRIDFNGKVLAVSGFQTSGIHATTSQLTNKHSLRETVWGTDIHRTWKNYIVGACGYRSVFSASVEPSEIPYKSYSFAGNQLWVTGAYARLHTREAIFYVESAISNSFKNFAFIGGICYMPFSELTLNWLYRYYMPGYYSLYANAYSSNTTVSNEEGYAISLNYQFNEKITSLIHFDFAQFPWLRYGQIAPTDKNRILCQQDIAVERVRVSVRYRYQGGDDGTDRSGGVIKKHHLFTLQIWQQVNDHFSMHHRIDFTSGQYPAHSKGIGLTQDFDWKVHKNIILSGCYALFNTDSWDSRIYVYEKNIWRNYSSAIYYGNGMRIHLMVSSNILKQVKCWIRYSVTKYFENVSTSANRSFNAELAAQVIWKWY